MSSSSPPSVGADWTTLGLDLRLLKAVRKIGLGTPTPIQAQCIPLALAGKDVLARAPTGSGKTIAYALPLLHKVLGRHDGGGSSLDHGVGAIILVPTRELCQQVNGVMRKLLGHGGAAGIRIAMLATPADAATLSAGSPPDVIVATPARLRSVATGEGEGGAALSLRSSVHTLVVDEADLLLSYGYGDDIGAIGGALPPSVQTLLLSATITPDLDGVRSLFLHNPATVDIEDGAADGAGGGLRQFWLRTSHADKFLIMYALFKLNRIPGRSLIFVNSVDRGFRLKLFLEQFGVASGVLNCELPLSSRWHAIEQFNRGLFDILIATDDPKLMAGRASESVLGAGGAAAAEGDAGDGEGEEEEEEVGSSKKKRRKKNREKREREGATENDAEFGVSRGVDFTDVTAVLNMDLPTSLPVYKHRVGRTARAGKGGTAISLVSEGEGDDERLLAKMASTYGESLREFSVDMSKLAAFRYRVDDAMRAVTRHAVKEARRAEIKRELLHSKKLAEHFDANPHDLEMLRHDKPLATARVQPHLTHVPSYLKPDTQGATEQVSAVGSSARRVQRASGKARKLYAGKRAGKKDPLKNFRTGGSKGNGRKGGSKQRKH